MLFIIKKLYTFQNADIAGFGAKKQEDEYYVIRLPIDSDFDFVV